MAENKEINEGLVTSDYDKERYEYITKLTEISNEEYNQEFLDYVKHGKMKLTNALGELIELNFKKIYLVTVMVNEKDCATYFADVTKGKKNIITNGKDPGYKLKSIIDFKYSDIFYRLYLSHIDEVRKDKTIIITKDEAIKLNDEIVKWNDTLHNEMPETRLINREKIEKANNQN